MVKKIKVVDVAQSEETVINQPIEEVKEEVKQEEETQPIDDKVEEAIVEVEEKKPKQILKQTIAEKNVTCEFCNKEMLMKTYKYTHKKLCELKHAPPPPPPPPPTPEPEPKKRVKREPKPKEVKPIEEKQPEAPQTSQFSGVVSFNDFPRVEDPYQTMRQQRLLVRQQRVKSLISQAV